MLHIEIRILFFTLLLHTFNTVYSGMRVGEPKVHIFRQFTFLLVPFCCSTVALDGIISTGEATGRRSALGALGESKDKALYTAVKQAALYSKVSTFDSHNEQPEMHKIMRVFLKGRAASGNEWEGGSFFLWRNNKDSSVYRAGGRIQFPYQGKNV